jgi:hypothetical protein
MPLTVGEKFKIASEDAFDRGTVVLAAAFGGEGQLTSSNRAFGQGGLGFARYWAAAYGDFAIGDYMTEGIFPALLRQDPRYFRRGTGSGWSRLGYAMGQIFWTHRDSGGTQFNYSEVIGNSVAVAISNAYYVDNRNVSDATTQLGLQIGVDMTANILKEFWPDVERKFKRRALGPKEQTVNQFSVMPADAPVQFTNPINRGGVEHWVHRACIGATALQVRYQPE